MPGREFAAAVRALPDLLAWWPFEDSLEPVVGTGAGQPTVALTHADGPGGGRALKLPAGGFVSFGEQPALDTPALSAGLFFRLDAPAPTRYNACLLAKRADSPRTRFSLHLRADLAELAIWTGGGLAWFEPPDGTPLEVGRWYQVAFSADGQGCRVWLDGAPCGLLRGSASLNLGQTGLPLVLGASATDAAEVFDGLSVDELFVAGRLLDDEQVAALADAAGLAERRQALIRAQLARAAERRRLALEREQRRAERIAARLADPALTARGERRVYQGEQLGAIAFNLGGIGTGLIQANGLGELETWQIFGNFRHARLPETFLAVRFGDVVMALQGAPAGPFAAAAGVSFSGDYPLGTWRFAAPALPVACSVTWLSPLLPFHERDSSMPCAIAEIALTNQGAAAVQGCVAASLLNAVGYRGAGDIAARRHESFRGNRNELVAVGGGLALLASSTRPATDPGAGTMALLAVGEPGARGLASYPDLDALRQAVLDPPANQPAAGPAPDGATLAGALFVPVELAPGATRTVRLVLAWSFPNVQHGQGGTGWEYAGQHYATRWTDALATAAEVAERWDELVDGSRRYRDTVYQSNLPWWLLDRVTSQVAVLRSMTCWQAADGYFGGWEGCAQEGGCCFGNCGHVWHYAQAHARLWPGLARRMREQAFAAQREDGALFFRQPRTGVAADGLLGEILEAWREHLTGLDATWLLGQWPRIKAALEYAIREWDGDEDGLFAGPQHNTLDAELGGACSWMGTLYLAALEAAARMAELAGEPATAARYRRIRAVGAAAQDQRLYNGEYYFQVPDAMPQRDYNTGCHIDQLLGEWWADQLGLGWSYPLERKQAALRALLQHNFQPDFVGVEQAPRKFAADEDAGLQMITWPHGGVPANHMLYASEVMTGFEYAAAATMLQHGLLAEGLLVARAVADRYDGRERTGLTAAGTASWGWSGNPFGDDECGKYYARAMSSWSLLLALQGFLYDGPAGRLGFAPRWRPDDHVSFFTAAEGYGLYRQQRAAGRQISVVELAEGRLEVRTLVLAAPAELTTVTVTAPGGELAVSVARDGERLELTFAEPVRLSAGESLTVEVGL